MSSAAIVENRTEAKASPSITVLYSLISLMVFFWSANFVIGKFALKEIPSLLTAGLRMLVAGGFMVPLFIWERRKNPVPIEWRDLRILVPLGICGVALNQIFFLLGLARTSVAHASFIVAMMPVMVLLIAALLGQEKLSARKITGLAIAISGVVVLNLAPSRQANGSQPTILGDVFIFLSILNFALFTVFSKKVSNRYSSITVNTFGYAGGGLIMLPFILWQSQSFSYEAVSAVAWSAMGYMSIFPSIICYLIFYYALTHVPASRVAAFCYLQPVIATLLATLMLNEPITAAVIAGGAVIFFGVYQVERG